MTSMLLLPGMTTFRLSSDCYGTRCHLMFQRFGTAPSFSGPHAWRVRPLWLFYMPSLRCLPPPARYACGCSSRLCLWCLPVPRSRLLSDPTAMCQEGLDIAGRLANYALGLFMAQGCGHKSAQWWRLLRLQLLFHGWQCFIVVFCAPRGPEYSDCNSQHGHAYQDSLHGLQCGLVACTHIRVGSC